MKLGAGFVALISAGLGLVMQDKLDEYWHVVVLVSLGLLVACGAHLYLRVRVFVYACMHVCMHACTYNCMFV